MKISFIVRNREDKPYFVATTSDVGTTFRAIAEDSKGLVDAFRDEYKNSKITKQELSVALDRGMTVEGPMPETLVAQALRREPKPKEKFAEKISVSDIPIKYFSANEKRETIQFKARAFVSESRKTTFNYEVKRVRALWDPGLSIPGTGRRGGWRCPVGTRYGGQITDRFGRNCGWGVARRIANAITNIGERLENVDDRRRGRRLERRNRRMLQRLGRAEEGGRIERGLRGVAEALEGGDAPKEPRAPKKPAPRRRGGVRGGGFDSDARDEGLRDSERRRVRRELEEPGAPRTGSEEIVEPKPKRPARARRRRASEERAKETAGKRPTGEPMEPSVKPEPKPKRKKPTAKKPEPKKPSTPTPEKPSTPTDSNDPFDILFDNINMLLERGNIDRLDNDDFQRMKSLWEEQEFTLDAQDRFEDEVRDGNWGDVEELKERIAINDQEKRGAAERISKDIDFLREKNRSAGEREGALRRIILNKQDIRRRDLENEMFQKAVDDPPWKKPEPPETPPSNPRAPTPTPPKPPTSPKADKPKSDGDAPKVKTAEIGGKQIKEDNKLAPLGDDGLPAGKAVQPNTKISNAEQAAEHLKNGGDLRDVPDIFVISALEANTDTDPGGPFGPKPDKRYELGNMRGGINGELRVFTDRTTGKKYLMKYEKRRAHGAQEDVAEVLGNNIAGRMGFPVGGFRFVGSPYQDRQGEGRAVLFEHVSNYVADPYESPAMFTELLDVNVADGVALTLLDFAILNVDRHGGNYFVIEESNGLKRIVPIDMSLTFHQAGFFDLDKDYGNAEGLQYWVDGAGARNNIINGIRTRVKRGELTRQQVKEQVIAVQRRLRESQEKVQFALFGKEVMEAAGTPGNPRKIKDNKPDHMVAHTDKRLQWLIDADPEEITKIILKG